MADTYYYNTTSSSGITLSAGSSPSPSQVPKGLIATRAVEVKDGWLGQVVVAEAVVMERGGFKSGQTAEEWATGVVIDVIKGLFTKVAKKASEG